jgi:hypothetical protein
VNWELLQRHVLWLDVRRLGLRSRTQNKQQTRANRASCCWQRNRQVNRELYSVERAAAWFVISPILSDRNLCSVFSSGSHGPSSCEGQGSHVVHHQRAADEGGRVTWVEDADPELGAGRDSVLLASVVGSVCSPDPLQDMVLLYPPNEREILIRRATTELATALGAVICHDKNMTYTMAEHSGVPYPASMLYHDEVRQMMWQPPSSQLIRRLHVFLPLSHLRSLVRRWHLWRSTSTVW